MKNKFITLMLVSALSVVALSGCGGSTTPTTGGDTGGNSAEVKTLDGAKNVMKNDVAGFPVTTYSVSGGINETCEKQVKMATDAGFKAEGAMSTPMKVEGVSYSQVLLKDKKTLTVMCAADPQASGSTYVTMTEASYAM